MEEKTAVFCEGFRNYFEPHIHTRRHPCQLLVLSHKLNVTEAIYCQHAMMFDMHHVYVFPFLA